LSPKRPKATSKLDKAQRKSTMSMSMEKVKGKPFGEFKK